MQVFGCLTLYLILLHGTKMKSSRKFVWNLYVKGNRFLTIGKILHPKVVRKMEKLGVDVYGAVQFGRIFIPPPIFGFKDKGSVALSTKLVCLRSSAMYIIFSTKFLPFSFFYRFISHFPPFYFSFGNKHIQGVTGGKDQTSGECSLC